jgi:hypothetical protein
MRSAAEAITTLTKSIITYNFPFPFDNIDDGYKWWDSDFKALNIGNSNPAGFATGVCADFASAYISMARAIGIPARRVECWFDGDGHAWTEVLLDGEWVHADPTYGWFDMPNWYLEQKDWTNMECYLEYEPGKMRADVLTTVKYAVGLENSSVAVRVDSDGNGTADIRFANRAAHHDVRDFRIEVIDNGGLNLQISGLSHGGVLQHGTEDRATLRVWGAEPCPSWKTYKVLLRITYSTINGDICSKECLVDVDVD